MAHTIGTLNGATISNLLKKLSNPDADFRFMSLNDLYELLSSSQPGFSASEYMVAAKTVDGILKTLDDTNGEVQNLAIKCLAPLITKINTEMWPPLIERVSNLKMENSIDPSIPFTALRTIVVNLPRPVPGVPSLENVQRAYEAISRVLVVRLVGYIIIPHGKKNAPTPPPGLLRPQESKGAESDALDVLIELIRCFGPMLQQPEIQALQTAVMDIMENDQTSSVVRKKAVAATSVLAVHFTDDVLSHTVSLLIENLNDPHLTPARRRLFLTLIGAMARSIPLRYGPYLETLAPFILSALSETEYQDQMEKTAEDMEPDMELDEVREAALITLESCLGTCSNTMSEFTEETIQGALRFLKYDPYFSGDNGDDEMDDMDDDGTNGYEDDEEDVFEEEAAFSDDDDVSWKIRRCAAKALYTLISTRASSDLLEDGTLYERIAPKLIARFNEREENVVLEILSTMSLLIRRTGQERTTTRVQSNDLSQGSFMGPPPSRKRRRGGSDVSMFDTQASVATVISPPGSPSAASSGPRASLAALTPLIVTSSTKLLDGKSLSTKQAAVTLLKDLVIVQHGGLSDHFAEIIRSISEASISSHSGAISAVSSSSSSSATGSTLRIEALQLMATLCETHSSAALRPYLDQMVPNVLDATKDKFYKISSEGLNALEQVIKVLTPPRWITPDDEQKKYISTTYDAVIDQITANDADVEVRHRAIHALGVLLSRTSGPDGPQLLSPSLRSKALEVLQTRLKSEITRLAAVKAIDSVALLAVDKAEFDPKWIQSVSLELGAQLRKSNRALRGSSLAALKDIVINPAGCDNLDVPTVKELITILMQLMDASDLLLLGPTLVILAKLVQANGKSVVSPAISEGICKLVLSPLRGSVLDALLLLTTALGESGTGNVLMTGLLQDVGVRGDPAIVGKVIGTLLVSGGPNIGVKTEDFTRELRSAEDDQRTCLALAVLGEAGLRLESKSPLGPETFSAHFDSKSDRVPLAAAIALGRAGAGNTSKFLPVILREMKTSGSSQYLLLHSINEILQQAHDSDDIGITEYLQPLWEKLLDTAKSEDNKAVGAECIGRLALIDPKTYYPSLQAGLEDKDPAIRGMVIQAFRYSLVDADEAYDEFLQPILVPMLHTMLQDDNLDIKRLALTTLNSAAHNKPDIILTNLGSLLPLVMRESHVRKELIREVEMGPFKHKVDDGLEVRKSAYETLYALMETSFSRMSVVEFFDRVLAGLEDEHDIRVLCNLMLAKLIVLDPDETQRRLDKIAEAFRKIISFKPRETAVKQEVEKAEEASKGCLKVSVALHASFPAAAASATSGQHLEWRNYWEWIRRDFGAQVRQIENAAK